MGAVVHDEIVKQWLVDTLPYEVMWMDQTGNMVYANTKFCNRLGYKTEEIKELSIFDINNTTTKESWKLHWEIVKKKGIHNFRATHRTKKGQFYEVETYSQFFSNNGKNLICAIVNDISASSFYRKLTDTTKTIANVGGWELNLQDGSLIVTNETLKIFNTSKKDDLLPGHVIRFFHQPETLKNLLRGAIRNAASFDTTLETKVLPARYIRAVGKPVLKGDKTYKIVGIYQDVTEQRERENALQLYKEVINNAEDLIFVIDRKGSIIHYSESVSKQLGYSKSNLNKATIFDLDKQVNPEWWKQHFETVVQEKCLRFEWMYSRKDGTQFPVDITANHLIHNGNDYNCAIVRDITHRKVKDLALYEALEEVKTLKEQLENENEYLQEEISNKINFGNIICKSDAYAKVLEKVNQVAPTDTTVLITGESGTGKELLASAVHNHSKRQSRPLIKVNCATLPKDLIESELFGHRKGAFTGALESKVGKFTLANGGTIFLDEIGEMPIDLQPKLLRVIQEGEFDELGGTKIIKVDVRIIAATNRNLEKMVKEGTFREDLYYRLNVFPIYNIPLRSRKSDIPILAAYFLEKYSARAGKSFKRLSKRTIAQLMDYNFPGNIRELENLIERAVIIENGTTLKPGSWMPDISTVPQNASFKSFEQAQRDYIIEVLNFTNWRVSGPKGAATILSMNNKTLFATMKRLGIEKQVILKKETNT